MSQAAKIYRFLRGTSNAAAEKALMLGMHRAEPPYRTVMLETILERDSRSSEAQLVSEYHEFSAEGRDMILGRIDSLYGPLRIAAFGDDRQTRLNVLTIIAAADYYRLTHVVVALLRDREVEVARRAGEVLLGLARKLMGREGEELEGADPAEGARLVQQGMLDRAQLVAAIKDGVQSFGIHQRVDALLAAMYVAPATEESVWQETLGPGEVIGRTVRYVLLNFDRPELGAFCVSALKNSFLRAIAARAIAVHGRIEFLAAVAEAVAGDDDDEIRRGLKLIRHPTWLNTQSLSVAKLGPADQENMIGLISCLGAGADEVGSCLYALAKSGCERVGLRAVEALGQLSSEEGGKWLMRLLGHKYGSVAAAALVKLLEQGHADMRRIMAEQFGSPHEQVRDLAARYFRDIAFGSYWNRFEQFSAEVQATAGRAIFKIDAAAQDKLDSCGRHQSAENRLRAVRIARLAGRVDQSLEFIMPLTDDEHPVVRSSAVAALGDVKVAGRDATYERLVAALDDQDPRVLANAIEALDRRGQAGFSEKISPLMNSSHGRVRANAIKAELQGRVYSSRRAIENMLSDQRPAHRISARWLLAQMQRQNAEMEEAADVALAV